MKKFNYSLSPFEINTFFPHERIKTKVQIVIILLEATRLLLFREPEEKPNAEKLVLQIKKMSRVFFILNKKYYSINFPFTFIINEKRATISFKNLFEIDSKRISDLLSILKDTRFNSQNCLDFIDPICDLAEECQEETWQLLRELLLMEDGYLRFDKDTNSYKIAKEKGKEHTHPEHHLDLFYTSNNSFKLGLINSITDDTFIDYLDIETDCMYLKQHI